MKEPRFNPFTDEQDMFKLLLAVVAGVLVVALIIVIVRALI